VSSPSSSLAPETAAVLFRQHAEGLRRLLRGVLRDPELAEEALQQTFLRLIQSGGEIGEDGRRAWMQRVALREAFALRRGQAGLDDAVERGVRLAGLGRQEAAASAQDEASRREAQRRAGELLGQLPPEQREVLHMRLGEDLSFREIAERLGVPRGTALTRMRLALEKLRRLRDEDDEPGGEPSVGASK